MEPKRMRARITEEDLKLSPEAGPQESAETWQRLIAAAWDVTIASVAFNDVRGPLARVPSSLEALEAAVGGVKDPETIRIVEEEVKAGIRTFSEMREGAEESLKRMEHLLRAAWKRRAELK